MTSLSSTTKIFFFGAAEVSAFIILRLCNNSYFSDSQFYAKLPDPSTGAMQFNAFLTFAPANVLNCPGEQHFLCSKRTTRREGQRPFRRHRAALRLLNDLQSFGLHRRWKRRVIELAAIQPGNRALDLCCGTGDLALALAGAARRSSASISAPQCSTSPSPETQSRTRKPGREIRPSSKMMRSKFHFPMDIRCGHRRLRPAESDEMGTRSG